MLAPAAAACVLLNATVLVKETGPVITMVPALVVMLPLTLMAVKLELVLAAEKLPNAVPPPTAADRVMLPDPDVKVRDCEPAVVALIVPPNEIAPPFALVLIVLLPAKIVGTAFVIMNKFAVMLLPIETELVPAADEIVIAPSRVVPPTTPVKVTALLEPEFKVNASAPAVASSSVEENVMPAPPAEFPPFVVSKASILAREATPVMLMVPPCVVMFPPMLMAFAFELVLVAEKLPSAVPPPIAAEREIVPDPTDRARF